MNYSEFFDGESSLRGWESRKTTGAIGFLGLEIVAYRLGPLEMSQSLSICKLPPRHGAEMRLAPDGVLDNGIH